MKATSIIIIAFFAALVGVNASAADWVLSPSATVQQRTVYYSAPATVIAPAPTAVVPTTTYYAPSVGQTVTSYYAPAVTATPTYSSRVTSYYAPAMTVVAPAPTVTYYAPTAVAAPVTTYYTPTTTYYAPAAVVTPTIVARPGVVRSKVYYPYEPVRNFFKAITP